MEGNTDRYDYIIVDSNNFFNRYYSVEQANTKDESFEANTECIANALRGINKLGREYGNSSTEFYMLFDNAKSKMNVRKLIDPAYKLNRQKKSPAFYRSLDMFRLILLSYDDRMHVVFGTGHEADDIAPVIVNKVSGRILVVSEDMDWCRLITDEVHLFNRSGIVGKSEFLDKYGFVPTEDSIILYKTIHGDTVDNIPIGIKNFPKHLTIRLVGDYKDIYDVKENLDIIEYLSDTWKSRIKENISRMYLNHELVSYVSLGESEIDKCTIDCKFKPKILKTLYETLNFNIGGVDKRLQYWLQHEQGRKQVEDDLFKMPKPKRW